MRPNAGTPLSDRESRYREALRSGNELGGALARAGQVDVALEVIGASTDDEAEQWFAPERAEGLAMIAAGAFFQAGDSDCASSLLRRARALVNRNPDDERTSRAFAALAGAEAAGGDFVAARTHATRARDSHAALRAHALALLAANRRLGRRVAVDVTRPTAPPPRSSKR